MDDLDASWPTGSQDAIGQVVPTAALAAEPVLDEDRVIALWGELEVMRRLAFLEDCGLFRRFPDNETNEVLIRRLATGMTIGIQVKTGQLPEPDAYRKNPGQPIELRARSDHLPGSACLDGAGAPFP